MPQSPALHGWMYGLGAMVLALTLVVCSLPEAQAQQQKPNILVILADQDARKNGVFVPFFGRPASTVRSPALMALKYGSAIIPLHVYRAGRHEHRVVATEPIEIPQGLDREEAILKITADVTARLESFIRATPEQWMWLHARWKTKPEGAEAAPRESVQAGAGG